MNNQMKVDINDIESEKCSKCGSELFTYLYTIKKLSAVLSPTGQETFVPVPSIMICVQCGEFYNPQEVKPEEEKPKSPIIQLVQ